MQMNNVLVSYFPCEFGDWLRYLIAEHEGFEKLDVVTRLDVDNMPVFGVTSSVKERRHNKFMFLDVKKTSTVKDLYSQMNTSGLRQVLKPAITENENSTNYEYVNYHKNKSHSLLYDPEQYGMENTTKYYDAVRQTNMSIIFVKLNPLSELFETYVKRKTVYSKHNVLSEEALRYSCQKSYIHNQYPKHEHNHVVEINNLADEDEEEYSKLITFLKVKPLSNWKSYAKELEKVKL